MRITDLMKKRPIFSLEIYPPKTDAGMQKLCGAAGTLDRLYELHPDYISCTYGAGGSNAGRNLEVLSRIARDGKTIPMTHFTCVGNSREEIRRQLETYLSLGVSHVLALRGDLPEGQWETGGAFSYATELVEFIRSQFGRQFTVAVAGSPEGHVDSPDFITDIEFLKQKQEEGADLIMTQLCWDMDQFRRWMEAIRAAGITLPVDVGIMPVLDQAATIRMALSRNACVMPRELCKLISRHWIFPDPFSPTTDPAAQAKREAFREEGMAYTVRQIKEYQDCDISGIHLYTLNRHGDAMQIARDADLLPEEG